ncbi:MAG: flagellar hook protein FlgE [Deltaproteobacteria bacterium]|nr:flagellar hook protein FlgE [Deltaproteobacteria bacterium]
MFALYPGSSGLNSFGEAMTVVGSNIANVNTTGYKSNRTNFQDMLATGIKGTPTAIGKGVNIVSVQGNFDQGSMEGTTQATDVALEGDGFFTVRDKHNRTTFTRAGNFKFDKDGFLVTQQGKQVLVRDVDPLTSEVQGFPKAAKLMGANDPPQATGDGTNNTGIKVQANLNAGAETPKIPFDPTNVQGDMYNFQTSVNVVDERGGNHVINVVFRKMEDLPPQINPATGQPVPGTGLRNQWQWYVVVPGSEVGAPPENLIAIGGGFMRFTENGRMLDATNGTFLPGTAAQVGPDGQLIPPGPPILVEAPVNPDVGVPQVTIPFTETPQVVGFNFGQGSNPLDPNDPRNGLDGLTQFDGESKMRNLEADGFKAGTLETISINEEGVIMGYFDNGNIRPMNRLVLTRFVNNQGLDRAGDNEYRESLNSGKPIQGLPNDGYFGAVHARNLEKSNVDLSTEFVKMIETQRAFQASAKGITTSDEMLADLVALKR